MKLGLLSFLSCLSLPVWAAEKIIIYTHYEAAPFLNAQHQGLTADLARELTQRSAGKYQFEVQVTPRKRIDFILNDPQWQGLVPWVNKAWFKDEVDSRFAWSAPLLKDADLVLSYQPLVYQGTDSLVGLRFGGILGHRYVDLERAITDGQIQRDNALNELGNIKKLKLNRVDFLFLSYSNWIAILSQNPSLVKGLHIAKKPRNIFERSLLISPNHSQLVQYVQRTVDQLNDDPRWLKKLSPYVYAGPQ